MASAPSPMLAAPASAVIERKVEAEMTRLLYRSSGFGLFSNFALALILVVGSLSSHPASLHGWWLGAIVAVTIGRYALNRAFERAQPANELLPRWRYAFIMGVATAGLIWGAAGWFYLGPDVMLTRLLLIFILGGLNAGAARSLASVPWSYRIYVATTLVPLLVRFALLPDSGGWLLALITITYALFLLNTAKLHYADLRRLWRLIFENEDLVVTLSEEKARAEAANAAKGDFLATMSHEIRTPMNGIMGMLQVLELSPLNAAQRSQVEIATGSADTLLRLLNDILDFSKIESGKLDFEHVTFALPPTISEVGALLRAKAAEKKLDLVVQLASNLPPHVLGDAVRLKQVLLNLTGNAIKFTERGRVEISVTVVNQTDRHATLRFAVSDTGIGIDAATQTRLFQVFSQGDSSMTRRFGGTGLGLAISQRLVHHMGGNIVVRSVVGQGSEFFFDLPLPISAVTRAPLIAEVAHVASLSARLLVVEDDRVNQRVIELLLEKLGCSCHIVDDGAAAVDAARAEKWDAILMDCQMPGMDGLEAARQIRRHMAGQPLPIIALTANAMVGDREACVAAGMDDFLAKPVRQEELRSCLERWLPDRSA